jgi:hypothetical protein
MDVNDNLSDVTTIYTSSTLGEIPGIKSSRAQREFSDI